MLTLKRSQSLIPVADLSGAAASDAAKLTPLLIGWSFFNLVLVAAVGVLLRALPYVSHVPFTFKNILHGHSHFAFSGWVMPVLLALILRGFPLLRDAVGYHHWRNISILMMVAAYGMLLSFPLQGYQPVSILFATLSIFAGYYLAIVVWKALQALPRTTAHRFLKAGLFYLTLASLGPFATGPLVALGQQESALYFDVIYGYLHFTYNGWFVFAVLALIYQELERHGCNRHGNKVFWLMHVACIPAYALSVLWHQPPVWVNAIGGLAALLQVAATVGLLADVLPLRWIRRGVRWMVTLALLSLVVKHLLQAASALPAVAQMAALSRNLVIAYLHLVFIGFVTLYVLAQAIAWRLMVFVPLLRYGLWIFLAGFVATECLLAGAGMHLPLQGVAQWLLTAALLMLSGLVLLCAALLCKQQPHRELASLR